MFHIIETKGPGGAETVYLQLVSGMAQRGYQPVPCVTGEGWAEQRLRKAGYKPLVLPTNGSADIKFLLKLISWIIKKRIDLIHSHLLGSNLYASLVGLITRKPVISTFHGTVDTGSHQGFLLGLKGKIISAGSSKIICVSNSLRDELTRDGWLRKHSVDVIYNGIDLKSYDCYNSKRSKKSLGFEESDILLGIIGNVRPAKGHRYFIESAPIVREKFSNVKYLIVGHAFAEDKRRLLELCRSLYVQDVVQFSGFRTDVADILANLDLFIVASTSEGFSIATIEALAMGVPVVATRCGGPEEILTDGKDGLLVPPRDPKALAHAIIRILSNKELSTSLAKQGKKTAQRFSLSIMIDNYERLYRQLLRSKS